MVFPAMAAISVGPTVLHNMARVPAPETPCDRDQVQNLGVIPADIQRVGFAKKVAQVSSDLHDPVHSLRARTALDM